MMPRIEVFRAGLRELGYVEGKNIIIEVRSAEGKRDRLPAIMAELLSLKVDIIVSAGAGVTGPAKDATSTIPIVMSQDPDPVASAFVASLARPGGNITGLSTFRPELSGKRLELVKETLPKLSRMAVFGTSSTPGHAQALKEVELAAAAVKVQLQYVDVLIPRTSSPHSPPPSKDGLAVSYGWCRAQSPVVIKKRFSTSSERANSR
jgi:ABC-type uncharacterized transport system substrate-binding protein